MQEIVQYDPSKEQLDNTIKLVSTGVYNTDNTKVASEFHQTNNEVIFINKGRRISWTPQNIRYIDETGMEDTIYTVQEVPLEIKANYARYNRSMPDIDDWFIQENDKLKHQILIQGFQPDPSPWLTGKLQFAVGGRMVFDSDLKIVTNGLRQVNAFETDGSIQLYDGDNLIFELPQVIAFDSAYDRHMVNGKYRVWFDEQNNMMFDIIIDYEWMTAPDSVYPIVIDPTVIVSSGYSTSGNGSRKQVMLSNGWLVTCLYNNSGYFYFYKSTDNGNTWSVLCNYYESGLTTGYWSLISKGTIVYALIGGANLTLLRELHFDATTQTNVTMSVSSNLETGVESSQFGNSLAYNSSDNTLHAIWASKNSSYPSNWNIRYTKGTISATDGSVTWGSGEQVTTNNGVLQISNPSIIVMNGLPTILVQSDNGTNRDISVYTKNYTTKNYFSNVSSTWGCTSITGFTSTYPQSNPSTIFIPQSINGLSNGRIWVGWHGTDATDYNYNNVRISYSDDGGATWSSPTKLTSGNTVHRQNASISCDKNGKLYVTYEDNGNIVQIQSNNNGATWSSPTTLDAGSNPNMMLDNTFTSNLVSWVYMSSSSVKFDTIVLNQPPTAPVNLTCPNFDATTSTTFTWTFTDPDPSDTQSAFQVQILDASNGTVVIDTNKTASTVSSYVLSGGLTNGKTYQWKVKTWDHLDYEGVWSNYGSFSTSGAPSVSITNPSNNDTINTSNLTVSWSYSSPQSLGQSAYQIQLLSSTNVVLWDSGKVTDSLSRNKTIDYDLQTSTSYSISITVWDSNGIQSPSENITFAVMFTPPEIPTFTATVNSSTPSVTITVNNPNSGTAVSSNEVYRRRSGETDWTLIGRINNNNSYEVFITPYQTITIGSNESDIFNDFGCPYGTNEYYVKAIGNNGTSSSSATSSITISFMGWWIVDLETNSYYQFLYNMPLSDITQDEERYEYKTFSTKPFVRYGTYVAQRGSLSGLQVQEDTSSPSGRDQSLQLLNLINQRKTLLLKNDIGDSWVVNLYNPKRTLNYMYAEQISVDWVEVNADRFRFI